MDLLKIDASVLEGGGQILRNALSLSCILKRPIKVFNIRARRSKPGLAATHLFGLNFLQKITNGKVSGNTIGSTIIEFYPGKIQSGIYNADTKTARSISVLLQVLLPVLLFGKYPSKLGLYVDVSAPRMHEIEFITEVLRPNLERFGITFDFDLFMEGNPMRRTLGLHNYYRPFCRFKIPAVKKLNSVQCTEFGSLNEIFGCSCLAGCLSSEAAYEMKNGAVEVLRNICPLDRINISVYREIKVYEETSSSIILGANTTNGCVLSSSGLGRREGSLGREGSFWYTGSNAAKDLLKCLESKQCTDKYVQDQLIIYMALADGESTIQSCKPTMHTLTAIHLAELMTGVKFEIIEQPQSENYFIKCKGIGHTNCYYRDKLLKSN